MDSLFDQPAASAETADIAARSSHPSRRGQTQGRGEVQGRIRELSEERRALIADDDISRRRAVAITRHRRRLDAATSDDRDAHLAVRRSLSIVH